MRCSPTGSSKGASLRSAAPDAALPIKALAGDPDTRHSEASGRIWQSIGGGGMPRTLLHLRRRTRGTERRMDFSFSGVSTAFLGVQPRYVQKPIIELENFRQSKYIAQISSPRYPARNATPV